MNGYEFGQFLAQNRGFGKALQFANGVYSSSGLASSLPVYTGVVAAVGAEVAPIIYGAAGVYTAAQAIKGIFGDSG